MKATFYSQYGEDKILNDLFKSPKGFCIEIGGFDGITGSNSYFFEQKGWNCIIIEPIPKYFELIKSNRSCVALNYAVSNENGYSDFFIADSVEQLSSLTPDVKRITKFNGAKLEKITVQKRTLNSILEEQNVTNIDFITIDVEGHEMEVMKGFDIRKYTPAIIILEDNSNGLDQNMDKYMEGYDYALFKRTGCNDWYCLKHLDQYIDPAVVKSIKSFKSKIRRNQVLKQFLPSFLLNIYQKIRYNTN